MGALNILMMSSNLSTRTTLGIVSTFLHELGEHHIHIYTLSVGGIALILNNSHLRKVRPCSIGRDQPIICPSVISGGTDEVQLAMKVIVLYLQHSRILPAESELKV